MTPNPKPPKLIRDKAYLDFVRSLPCCITGSTFNVVCHHLLRTPEKAMGRKSGDDKAIPLASHVHDALHADGNETRFLASHGIDGSALAKQLYAVTGDHERGLRVVRGHL